VIRSKSQKVEKSKVETSKVEESSRETLDFVTRTRDPKKLRTKS
jgi:hypothetical protein